MEKGGAVTGTARLPPKSHVAVQKAAVSENTTVASEIEAPPGT